MRVTFLGVAAMACLPLWAGAQAQPGDVRGQAPVYREELRLDRKVDARSGADTTPRRNSWRVDKVQVKRDADELQRLTRSVAGELGQAEKGLVAKDLGENLKKIQKLSKRLRSELYL